jgi:hypothetical protein
LFKIVIYALGGLEAIFYAGGETCAVIISSGEDDPW